MLRSLKQLEGYTIRAVDGNIGKVHNFYFDDFDWKVRYLVADVYESKEHSARRVLLSPLAFDKPEDQDKIFPVNLTGEMVFNSPDVDTERPVSRQQEIELHNYYNWPFYWLTPGVTSYPFVELVEEMKENAALPQTGTPSDNEQNDHLRSLNEVIGYGIAARDGDIGHVSDFIANDDTWKIEYIIVDTGNWLPGRKVIISPQWKKEIIWSDATMSVDLRKETIQKSPEYNPKVPLTADYEQRLSDYYRGD